MSGSSSKRAVSLAALGLGAACFGSIPLFAKLGFASGISPGAAVILRYILPALLLAPYLPQALRSGPNSWRYMLFGMILGFGAWSYFYALNALPIYVASSLFFSYPALLVLFKTLAGIKLSSRDKLILVLVASALVMIIATTPLPQLDLTAVFIGLIGPLCYGGLQLVTRKTPSYLPSLAIAACIFSGAIISALPFALAESQFWQGVNTAPIALPVLGLALLAGLLPQLLLAYGSSDQSGRKTAYTTGSIEFGLALFTGFWVFSEPLGVGQAIGFLSLLAALYLTNEPSRLPRYLQD
ncbi:EamA-like transporter family protein [Pseudovibrio axinellae]|uniref:EamA-like transporter family protein n=2 Tax=Pseudovibrio axinellae TaxID=989403 RepID=A0A166ADT9_9HYPH|nr:EamA-like transporter family protein [Pseudovibrio axinellae]SEP82138.1 Threonine/homoserine efflux transporter RhtA [Pseudovibrio axinellae]